MNQMNKLNKKQFFEYLSTVDSDEVRYLVTRYCGPNNRLLFERTFENTGMKHDEFYRALSSRLFTEILESTLNSPSDTIKE